MSNKKRFYPWKNVKANKYSYIEQWCESGDRVYSDDEVRECHKSKKLKIHTDIEKLTQTNNETGVCTRSRFSYETNLNPFNFGVTPILSFASLTIWKSFPDPNASRMRISRQNSDESGVETESIFSFASKLEDLSGSVLSDAFSVSRNSLSSDYFSSSSNDSWECKSVVKQRGTPLPTVKNDAHENDVHIPQISSNILANLLQGDLDIEERVLLIDCRFPYEYEAGHVRNAVNIYTCQKLLQYLFYVDDEKQLSSNVATLDLGRMQKDDTIYIFYCEFSSFRGPKLAQCLRGLDRLANMNNTRNLFIPNIYVLQHGYSQFHHEFRGLCHPDDYVSMKQVTYCLRNQSYPEFGPSQIPSQLGSNHYRKQQKTCENEMRCSEKALRKIVTKQTTNCDILKLFSVHPRISAPL